MRPRAQQLEGWPGIRSPEVKDYLATYHPSAVTWCSDRLRAFLRLFGGNLAGADDVGTVEAPRLGAPGTRPGWSCAGPRVIHVEHDANAASGPPVDPARPGHRR